MRFEKWSAGGKFSYKREGERGGQRERERLRSGEKEKKDIIMA